MELALLLLIIVFAELGLTVWLLARHRDYVSRVREVEMQVAMLSDYVDRGQRSEPVATMPLEQPSAEELEMLIDLYSRAKKSGDE